MDNDKLLIELEKNIKQYSLMEEKKSMIMLAIYQKNIEQLKENKLKEIKEYFDNQISYYEQDSADYEVKVKKTIKDYKFQMEQLIKAYDHLYLNTFKNMRKAIDNQLIAMGNVVTLWNRRKSKTGLEFAKVNNQIVAILQKKVNYAVIVEECKARLNWCIENVSKDLDNIFVNNFYQLDIYRGGFFAKIKRKILNIFSGKKQLTEVINKYQRENLKQITDNSNLKAVEILAISKGVLQQIQSVEQQITLQYDQAMQNG